MITNILLSIPRLVWVLLPILLFMCFFMKGDKGATVRRVGRWGLLGWVLLVAYYALTNPISAPVRTQERTFVPPSFEPSTAPVEDRLRKPKLDEDASKKNLEDELPSWINKQ